MTEFYKIRNVNTGLYRLNMYVWNKSGKVYTTLGPLRSLLTSQIRSAKQGYGKGIGDWEIVKFEVKETARVSPSDVMDPKRIVELLST